MIKIFASRCSWNNLIKYYSDGTIFVHVIDVTPENLNYRFMNLRNNECIFNVSLRLEELKKHPSFADQTWWSINNSAVNTKPIFNTETNTTVSEHVQLVTDDMCCTLEIANKRILTKSILDIVPEYNSTDGSFMLVYKPTDGCGQVPINIFVPSEEHDFTNFVYQVTKPRKASKEGQHNLHQVAVLTNSPALIDLDNNNEQSFQPNWKWLFSPIELTFIENSHNIEFNVVLSDASFDNPRVYRKMPKNCGEFSMPKTITTNFKIDGVANKIKKVFLKSHSQNIKDMEIDIINGIGKFSLPKSTDMNFTIGYKSYSDMVKYDNGIIL